MVAQRDDSEEWSASDNRKLAAHTARRLEDDIIAAGWSVGSVFGSELELMQRYEVSRAVLREAIRLVEHHEVARMRRGPSGGLIVTAPGSAAAIWAVVVYLEHVEASVDDLMFTRRVLEPLAATLAADQIDEDGIRELRAVLAEQRAEDARPLLLRHDQQLHESIAVLAHNETLALFVTILVRLTTLYATTRPRLNPEETSRSVRDNTHAHESLVSAVASGNAALAGHRANLHLEALQEFLRPRRRIRSDTRSQFSPHLDHKDKLAEIVANKIRADIAESLLPVGSVLGSERDLLERYGVSRAALREAVRLLEFHSVAEMRRGPGGGLVVTEPDPAASIEAAALYLHFREARSTNLLVVREALELGALDLLSQRPSDEGLAKLQSSVDVTNAAGEANGDQFHAALADLAENPVLALLLRITLSLGDRGPRGQARWSHQDDERARNPEADAEHRAIVAAISEGDWALARHRLSRHLRARLPSGGC